MDVIWILAGLVIPIAIFVLGIVYLVKVIKKNDNGKWIDL